MAEDSARFPQPRKARRMFGGVDFSQLCVISSVQVCGLAERCPGSDHRGPALAGTVPADVHRTSGDRGVHDRSERVERPATVDDVGNDPGGDGRDRDLRFQPSAVAKDRNLLLGNILRQIVPPPANSLRPPLSAKSKKFFLPAQPANRNLYSGIDRIRTLPREATRRFSSRAAPSCPPRLLATALARQPQGCLHRRNTIRRRVRCDNSSWLRWSPWRSA